MKLNDVVYVKHMQAKYEITRISESTVVLSDVTRPNVIYTLPIKIYEKHVSDGEITSITDAPDMRTDSY